MVSKIVSNLALASSRWERIVFGISDHTDNANGDPFAGYTGRKKSYVAAPADNFLDILFQPWKNIINDAAESYLWLFCCGAIINNQDSFSRLKASVVCHQLSAAIAFNAPRFQPSFTAHLLLAFAEHAAIPMSI
ncbi:hypothetical protein AZE42_13708 [Rhizopogon vesiculosus]|uniref:Uncharacterized protein n=1 Tax=Rhizopogon vesiculosus TaxID=180088 RepID=A0A1J8QWC5_9AGAM|nr:hypothetical protein AZE42_13708 [Rhizopogon vesiculosus]